MTPRPDLHPATVDTTDLMRRLQRDVAEAASFSGELQIRDGEDVVAAVDQAFPHQEEIVSGAITCRGDEILGRVQEHGTPSIGYVPGLLAFREGPTAIAALESLTSEFEVVFVDGNGRIHPRQAGLATHLGVVLDIPTIGVAKSLLCGDPTAPIEGLQPDESVAIHAGDDVAVASDTVIGHAVQTRQFSSENRHINPLIVSPGHRVNPQAAVEIVLESVRDVKLPWPLHVADRYVTRLASDE